MPDTLENRDDASINNNNNDIDDMLENGASIDYYANFDGDGTKLPTVDQIMAIIEQMKDLNDTEREQLKANIMQQQAEANEKLSQYAAAHSAILGGGGGGGIAHTTNDYLIFTSMIVLIITVFVLFGYKLYKSLVEKQRKREEKLKAKQLKKKK